MQSASRSETGNLHVRSSNREKECRNSGIPTENFMVTQLDQVWNSGAPANISQMLWKLWTNELTLIFQDANNLIVFNCRNDFIGGKS